MQFDYKRKRNHYEQLQTILHRVPRCQTCDIFNIKPLLLINSLNDHISQTRSFENDKGTFLCLQPT